MAGRWLWEDVFWGDIDTGGEIANNTEIHS